MALANGSAGGQDAGAPAVGRQQRIDVSGALAGLADAGNVQDVGDDSRCRGPCTGAGPIEHHPADRISLNQDGVVHTVDAGQGVILGNQRRLNPQGERQGVIAFITEALGNGEQLDAVTQLTRVVDIAAL